MFCSPKNTCLLAVISMCCLITTEASELKPAEKFDLSHWSITVPLDGDSNGKADVIDVSKLATYYHPDFFYLDENERMVFTAPNKAVTTQNSTNTRSELRQMIRGDNKRINTNDPANNFCLSAHQNAAEFAAVGGKLEATLSVNHVALNAGHPEKYAAYSVVVGQIHASKSKQKHNGFGWGNEPLKIFYKKWPEHNMGSVFWTYERNLPKTHPDRTDIIYPVWGNTWDIQTDPGSSGIALDQEFSYSVNVYMNTMYLKFESKNKETIRYQIDLSNNLDAYGKVDKKDHAKGYSGDTLYFKAGAYDQCSTRDAEGVWYAACGGTGDWKTDYKNGDYVRATFSRLVLRDSEEPDKRSD